MFYLVDTKTNKPGCLGLIIGYHRNFEHARDAALALQKLPQIVLVQAESASGAKYLHNSKLLHRIEVKRNRRCVTVDVVDIKEVE